MFGYLDGSFILFFKKWCPDQLAPSLTVPLATSHQSNLLRFEWYVLLYFYWFNKSQFMCPRNCYLKKRKSMIVVFVVPSKPSSFAWGIKWVALFLASAKKFLLVGRAFYKKKAVQDRIFCYLIFFHVALAPVDQTLTWASRPLVWSRDTNLIVQDCRFDIGFVLEQRVLSPSIESKYFAIGNFSAVHLMHASSFSKQVPSISQSA